jgi:hypothetical protein
VAFFALIPTESLTLNNFIAYMSSLSTAVMVLIYILTTSQQLNTMQSQLTEMQLTRSLQNQPLIFPTIGESKIITPNFWGFPADKFKEMHLVYTVAFNGKVENLGNSPAISVDIFQKIVCTETRGSMASEEALCLEDKTVTKLEELERAWQKIECLPQKDSGSKDILAQFPDDHALIESFLNQRISLQELSLTILYRNVLGASFRTDMTYAIHCQEADTEKLKLFLKAMESGRIDFAEDLEEYKRLRLGQQSEKAREISSRLRKDFPIKYKLENIPLQLNMIAGSFSVKPITEKEYSEELTRRMETVNKTFPLVHLTRKENNQSQT